MMQILHDSVIRLYREGQLTAEGLGAAAARGWISAEEAESLKAERA